MTAAIKNLLKNSRLPGPRGNLELLYSFAQKATAHEVDECLSYYKDDLYNSPEEFVVMCGIAGFCILNKNDIKGTIREVRQYASHGSWRIREAVAIGIQEISEDHLSAVIGSLRKWMDGNYLEKRAIVAALCEPKLLREKPMVKEIIKMLNEITLEFEKTDGKLSDTQNSLRKTLGYGWSVAMVSFPEAGKEAFEKIAKSENRHIKWIVKENLKKKRLAVMDKKWVDQMKAMFSLTT